MKPSKIYQTHSEKIRSVVAEHRASNPRLFGSVLHGEDKEGSDLDILVDPSPEMSLMDIGAIRHKLKSLMGFPVDVLTPAALPDRVRERVLQEARPI
ncbi:nucleotidyltransferase family protein [Roseibium aggregatum]|jgi:hypothetical protein|uniref:nucleotidyltransferase family protein n=1 Tax=Roseibium aggregatum TaxID=187304 RepID=UPI0006E125B0|nr:nucleotidyltransferase family protein [Roseibium aggregatum]